MRIRFEFALCIFLVLIAATDSTAQKQPKIRDLNAGEYDVMIYGVEKNGAIGFSTAVGDVNGDGVADLIIGAMTSDAFFKGKMNDAGVVSIYFGRKTFDRKIDLSTQADVMFYGGAKVEAMGFAVASADLNGDGIRDIIMGAPFADGRIGTGKFNNAGITYVVFGRKTFPDKKVWLEPGKADVELHSVVKGEYSGSALATGDFNGDGLDDVLIGAPFSNQPTNDAGTVYVVCGSKSLSGTRDLGKDACATAHGLESGDRLVLALAGGDLNGDGIGDMVLGALETDAPNGAARNVGQVTVITGRKNLPAQLNLKTDAAFRFSGSYHDDYVGQAMAVADVNGDGIADLMIGVPFADLQPAEPLAQGEGGKKEEKQADAGRVLIFYGGKDFSGEKTLKEGAPLVLLGVQGGSNYGDHAGGTVALGDLNGDGAADLIVGAPLADVQGRTRTDPEQMKDVGAVFVVYGGKGLPKQVDLQTGADEVIYGAAKNDFLAGVALTKPRKKEGLFGLMSPDAYRKAWMTIVYDRFFSKAVTAGDINGDGITDLVVAAPAADGPGATEKIDDAGAVYIFFGKK